jgi:hypothetical protein
LKAKENDRQYVALDLHDRGGPQVRFLQMKDDWSESLRCPICGKTGLANLWQDEDTETATVERVPVGFKIVLTEYGPNFNCETCDVAVNP